MKFIFIALTLVLALASGQAEFPTVASTECSHKLKKQAFCPEIFSPTFGVYKDNSFQFFSSGCNACTQKGVRKYYQFKFCPIEYKNAWGCFDVYDPYCGYVEKDQTFKQYGNECEACSSGEVNFVSRGLCPKLGKPRK